MVEAVELVLAAGGMRSKGLVMTVAHDQDEFAWACHACLSCDRARCSEPPTVHSEPVSEVDPGQVGCSLEAFPRSVGHL